MARVSFRVKIFYEDVLFVDSQAYLSRRQALKIPGLQVEENEQKTVIPKQLESRSQQKRSSDNQEDEMIDENQEAEAEDLEMEDENQQEGDMQIDPSENIQYAQQDDDDDDLDNEDMSSISRSLSNLGNFGKYKTKRQKGEVTNFLQLPNKRPRKENKKIDQATQIIKRQQKQRKRKQYIKKMMQAQQKATFEKILNETGRKFKQMQQKQMKQVLEKQRKVFKTLGDVPKIITKQNNEIGNLLFLHKTSLFDPAVLHHPQIKMGQICEICNQGAGKYKSKTGKRFCSIKCFKALK